MKTWEHPSHVRAAARSSHCCHNANHAANATRDGTQTDHCIDLTSPQSSNLGGLGKVAAGRSWQLVLPVLPSPSVQLLLGILETGRRLTNTKGVRGKVRKRIE
jgi:hypothetical protein